MRAPAATGLDPQERKLILERLLLLLDRLGDAATSMHIVALLAAAADMNDLTVREDIQKSAQRLRPDTIMLIDWIDLTRAEIRQLLERSPAPAPIVVSPPAPGVN